MNQTLALEGGDPVRDVPFPSWPPLSGEPLCADVAPNADGTDLLGEHADNLAIDSTDYLDQAYRSVQEVLSSGRLNYHTGEKTKQFEEAFAAYVGAPYALAVANGTVALEIALRTCGVGPGDEVIVPSRTFIATAGAVVGGGAIPGIADIDPATNCLTTETCAEVLTAHTKAILPVHLGGYPAPTDEIQLLAQSVGAAVIEDCAQALGARYRGMHVGASADAGCFSFCQDKILPLGEGGMITFTDEEAYKRAWAYRDHGRSWEKAHNATVGAASSQFQWLNDSFGTNARMTEVQGAIGVVALAHLEWWSAQRALNAHVLVDAMEELSAIEPLVISHRAPDSQNPDIQNTQAFYRLYARIDNRQLAEGWTRDRIIDAINAEGVPAQYGSCALIGSELAFESANITVAPHLPGAQSAHESSIAFFVHPTASVADMNDVATALHKVMTVATR